MAPMRSTNQTSEVHPCEPNDQEDRIKQEIENLKNENKMVKDEIHSLKADIKHYRVLFVVCLLIIGVVVAIYFGGASDKDLHTTVKAQDLVVQRLEQELDGLKRQTQKEKEVLQKNIDDMRVHNWGEFVWSIDGWTAKVQSARGGKDNSIISETFYSHKNGYKLCLSVWPDGYGDGKGTHLAVYFHLVPSEFNDILTWPFKRLVTLSVINQHTGIDHASHLAKYDHLPNHINWNKPANNKNGGLGTNKLIPLADLSSNTELCQNDRIFIRCIVK